MRNSWSFVVIHVKEKNSENSQLSTPKISVCLSMSKNVFYATYPISLRRCGYSR